MNDSLAQLIIGERTQKEEIHPDVVWVRERFPANEMMPMVERTGGKPSERVRLRQSVLNLRKQGLGISSYDSRDPEAQFHVRSSFDRSGTIGMVTIDADSKNRKTLEDLRVIQETLLEQNIPLVACRELDGSVGLQLHYRISQEELPWFEIGLDGVWEMPMAEAMVWAREFKNDWWTCSSWQEVGFSLDEAREWYAGGDGFYWADDALEWKKLVDQGITPELAIRLSHAGISPEQALLVRRLWPNS